ncbi:hypothetical protein GmHk_10G030180 [Glycine max]|nr:hypothetical protein GmHk_10G030180 [Glycine max]
MIRIEALRWALDRVLGRVLGGQITDDEKEVPQCRRLTTFACRQQTTVAVAKNVDHVDHAADELHEQPRELVTDHEHTELKLTFHGRKVGKFGRSALEIEGIVTATELSAFHTFDAIDVDKVVDLLIELLEANTQEARDEIEQCKWAYVCLASLRDIYRSKYDTRQ